MPRIVRSRCEGARGKCCSRTRPTPPRPIAMVRKSAAIAYPHPRHPHTSACGRVRPARWRVPKLPHVFRTDLDDARLLFRVCAGHRPGTEGRDDRLMYRHLDTPTGYMKRALDRPSFPLPPVTTILICEPFTLPVSRGIGSMRDPARQVNRWHRQSRPGSLR